MITEAEKVALNQLLLGNPFQRSQTWLKKTFISDEQLGGWPHLTDQDYPTVWGGTLDGIRGLLAIGESKYDPLIQKGLGWLLNQQRDDGGFGSRELMYSAVEATAWVLIVLKDLEIDLAEDKNARAAINYIEQSVGSSGELATSLLDLDNARNYPALLSLWALHGYSDKAKLIARNLKDGRDFATGGWGLKPQTPPTVTITSQAVYVLLLTNNLQKEDVIVRQAVEYILSTQKTDGSWDNTAEHWFSKHQPFVPNHHTEFATPWAVLALVKAGLHVTSDPVAKAIRWLIERQQSEGYWLYDSLDESKYIWCTADTIASLAFLRQCYLEEISKSEINHVGMNPVASQPESVLSWSQKILSWIRINFTNLAISILAVYVFREPINTFFTQILNFLRIQKDQLIGGIVSNGLYAILVLGIAYLLKTITNNNRNGRGL